MKKLNIFINYIELKYRIFYLFSSIIFSFVISFYYKVEIFFLISNFFLDYKEGFIYTNLLDPVIIYLKLSLMFSLIVTFPLIIYLIGFYFFKAFYTFYLQFYFFYGIILYFIGLSVFLILSNYLLPILFKFLINFQRLDSNELLALTLQATINQYYNFYFYYIFFYLIIIIIPNFFLLLVILKFINKNSFLEYNFRKYLYFIILVCFFVIAPPDLLIQLAILPIIIICLEIYIYIITFFFTLYYSCKIT